MPTRVSTKALTADAPPGRGDEGAAGARPSAGYPMGGGGGAKAEAGGGPAGEAIRISAPDQVLLMGVVATRRQ